MLSHLIEPALLRGNDFEAFMTDRQKWLLGLIAQATGKAPYAGAVPEEGEDVEADLEAMEATRTIAVA